jgi:hypothetical protein
MDEDEPNQPLSLIDRLRALNAGSAAALFCASLALLFVSIAELDFLIKPAAGVGLLLGLLAGVLPAVRRKTPVGLSLIVSALCLLILLFLGRWPNVSAPPPPPMAAIQLQQKGMTPHQTAGAEDWVDAATSAVQKDDIRVQVVSARIGRVELKNRGGSVSTSDRQLVIRLRLSYQGVLFQPTPYDPWCDRADAPSKHAPMLADNTDRNYTQKVFDPGWNVVGRAIVEPMTPGHQVKEVLVYPIPPADVEYLRLKLPASAVGLSGEFHFQIPRSMIHAP